MAACRFCGAFVEFRPHPTSGKPTPFNGDGEIHFSSCLLKNKAKTEYRTREDVLCKTCEELPLIVFSQPTAGGDRLGVLCDNLHHTYLPVTENNRSLINGTYEQAKMLKAIRYSRSPLWRKNLVREYREKYRVTPDMERYL